MHGELILNRKNKKQAVHSPTSRGVWTREERRQRAIGRDHGQRQPPALPLIQRTCGEAC